jgi:hypothetical protein
MLTLKVNSNDHDGHKITAIISGARISYHHLKGHPSDVFQIGLGCRIYGTIPEDTKDTGYFIYFEGRILDQENMIIEDFIVFPYSECFVTEEGKTVDVFISKFI